MPHYKVAYTVALYQNHGKMGAEISALAPGDTIRFSGTDKYNRQI